MPRTEPLLPWQWNLYPANHRDRRNLAIHVATQPVFVLGTLALVASPWRGIVAGVGGVAAMAFAMILQGRGHRLESTPPVPFDGPRDVVQRIFAEQWWTFPRFMASGRFGDAWRAGVLGDRVPRGPEDRPS